MKSTKSGCSRIYNKIIKTCCNQKFLPSKLSRQSIMSEEAALGNSASLSTHHASQPYKPLRKLKKQAINVPVLTIKTPSA